METVFYNDDYLQQLVAFYKTVWDDQLTEHLFLSRRQRDLADNPYAETVGFPVAISVEDGRVMGHLAATPCKLWANNQEFLMCWLSGLHVLPEGRGKGIATLLLKKFTHNMPVLNSFPVIEPSLRAHRNAGFTIVGKLPEFIRIIDAKSFFPKIDFDSLSQVPRALRTILNLICSLRGSETVFSLIINTYKTFWNSFLPQNQSRNPIRTVKNFDTRVDNLWEKNKASIKFAQVRKHAYLNWRFKSKDGWIKVIYEHGDEILAYAAVSVKHFSKAERLSDMKVVSIIDMLWDFDKPTVLRKLIHYIAKLSYEARADILLCSINSKEARKILTRNGFIPIPRTIHFGLYSSNNGPNLSHKLSEWFLTRGDSDTVGSLSP